MTTEIDETDKKILMMLQQDGRLAYNDIAKSLGMSQSTVYDRVRRMEEDGIIERFTIILNPRKVGKSVIAFIGLDTYPKEIERIAEAVAKFDEVSGVYLTTGDYDITIKVIVDSMNVLNDFVIKKLSTIDGLRNISTQLVLGTYKSTPVISL